MSAQDNPNHWRDVRDELDEAAEHLDAAARAMTLIASRQAVVSTDPWNIGQREQPQMLGQMPETLEGLTLVAREIGRVGAQVHSWTKNVGAYIEAPAVISTAKGENA